MLNYFNITLDCLGKVGTSVTRFCEISPLWHNFKVLGKFLCVYLVFGKMLILHWQKCHAIGQICIAVDGQIF